MRSVQTNSGLTKQSLKAAALAAYVGALATLLFYTIWRIQNGADARMCPIGSRDLTDLCTIGELSLAFLFDAYWAIFALPFALVLTTPCAIVLGRLAPRLENRFEGSSLALMQYGLGMAAGFGVGYLIQAVAAGAIAACAGVWMFRRARYVKAARYSPMGEGDCEAVEGG